MIINDSQITRRITFDISPSYTIQLRPICRLLKRGGCKFKGFYKGGANSDFEAKIKGVNSVSGEKLHDFEIICPASGGDGGHLHPATTPAPRQLYYIYHEGCIMICHVAPPKTL